MLTLEGSPLGVAGRGALPLSDRRVLLTAPRQYAEKLAGKLVEAGARPLWVPAIQITRLQSPAAHHSLVASLLELGSFTDLAFTSRNGVTAAVAALGEAVGGPEAAVRYLVACGVRCWALGADAEALRELGVHGVLTPTRASTQGLVEEMVARGLAAGARVLCPVPAVLPPLEEPFIVPRFLEALKVAGAEPVRVDCYETSLGCSADACEEERLLLEKGVVRAIAFSSTAEVGASLCG